MVTIVSFPGGFIKRKIEGILHLWGEIVKLDKKRWVLVKYQKDGLLPELVHQACLKNQRSTNGNK